MTLKLDENIKSILDQLGLIDGTQRELLLVFLKTFVRDFILAWTVRGGVSFLPYLLKSIRLKG